MSLQAWWGETRLTAGESRVWELGSLRLAVRRGAAEVVVVWRDSGDPLDASLLLAGVEAETLVGEQERLVVNSDTVTLGPLLPDRAVVARPEELLTVPKGAEVTAYVSAPVHVHLSCGAAEWEAPTHRLSDTWFGPNTREGELAYASRTLLKLDATAVLRRPHRAITPIVIRNQANDPLTVDRIRVPLPRLSLYSGTDALWTSAVSLERSSGDVAAVRVRPGPPSEAEGGELLCGPRRPEDDNAVLRVFSLLEKMK